MTSCFYFFHGATDGRLCSFLPAVNSSRGPIRRRWAAAGEVGARAKLHWGCRTEGRGSRRPASLHLGSLHPLTLKLTLRDRSFVCALSRHLKLFIHFSKSALPAKYERGHCCRLLGGSDAPHTGQQAPCSLSRLGVSLSGHPTLPLLVSAGLAIHPIHNPLQVLKSKTQRSVKLSLQEGCRILLKK